MQGHVVWKQCLILYFLDTKYIEHNVSTYYKISAEQYALPMPVVR